MIVLCCNNLFFGDTTQRTTAGRWRERQRSNSRLIRLLLTTLCLAVQAARSTRRWRACASAPACSTTVSHWSSGNQAQPPFCVGQPFPALVQHHDFLATDQPATQLANPALQSNGADVETTGTHPPPPLSQPLPWTRQHQAFFGTDQPACQFANPSKQL